VENLFSTGIRSPDFSARSQSLYRLSYRAHTITERLQAPDQGSTVYLFLFPRLKSIMKGASFADVAAIQECVTAVLRSILKEAFADSFQKRYERCQ
jgi:hypothetical protein